MRRVKYFLYQDERERIEAIKAYIVANLDSDLRIGVLADLFHIHKTTLQRHFFVHEKNTIHNYIVECRMEKAQQLLHSGKLTVREISKAVGSGSLSTFTHQFHQHFGYSPIDYRKKSDT